MISALCFDLDGTLAHYTGDFAELNRVTFESLNLPQQYFKASLDSFARGVRQEGYSTVPIIIENVLNDLGLVSDNVLAASELMISEYVKDMALLPGAKEVLEACAHLPRAIITNGPSDMQRAAIKQVGLENEFRAMVVSGDDDVAVRKPNPKIFEIACERLNVAPESILMIGDNLEADVRGALAYGMSAIWIGQDGSEDVEQVADTKALAERLKESFAG